MAGARVLLCLYFAVPRSSSKSSLIATAKSRYGIEPNGMRRTTSPILPSSTEALQSEHDIPLPLTLGDETIPPKAVYSEYGS